MYTYLVEERDKSLFVKNSDFYKRFSETDIIYNARVRKKGCVCK